MGKKIAIIGAGASGLTAIKCCLDEHLEPTCFERSEDIGGLWNYSENAVDGQPSVMRSTVINTSKEITCYSDFPIPREYPIFMHNTYIQKYFNLYADKFNLRKYIKFNTEVLSVKRSATFKEDGKWVFIVKDRKTEKEETGVFDAVMICTGHHATRYIPTFQGLDKFKGKVLHSNAYRDQRGYDGKRVLIIGIGNSGGDAAVELGRVASKVYLSTRRGTWILQRIAGKGLPLDMTLTRASIALLGILPISVINRGFEKGLNNRIDHELYSLKPNYPPTAQHPMVNDDLPNKIIAGMVIIKPNVKQFTETGVEFDDGTFEDNIDVVILATGYSVGFPFLEKGLVDVEENKLELFKNVFIPDLDKQTMAMIGYVQPLGAINPISELQSRLATRVFKGDVTLPSRDAMWQDIIKKQKEVSRQYIHSRRHTIQVQFLPYLDEIAELTGCRPDIKKLFLTDPRLGWNVLFGPPSPYQYRLFGHGKWEGAREAILTQWERAIYPLKTRNIHREEKQSAATILGFFIFITVVIAFILKMLIQ